MSSANISPSTTSHQLGESRKSIKSTFVKAVFFFTEAALAINGMAVLFLLATALFLHLDPAELILGYLPFAAISLVPIAGGIASEGSWRTWWHALLHMPVIWGQIHHVLPLRNPSTLAYMGIASAQLMLCGFVFKVFCHLERSIDGEYEDKVLQALYSCIEGVDKVEETELEQQRAVEEGQFCDYSLSKPPSSYETPQVKEKIGAECQALLGDMGPT